MTNIKERRQFAGALMVFGLAAMVYPISQMLLSVMTITELIQVSASSTEFDWPTVLEFFGHLLLMLIGFLCISIGFIQSLSTSSSSSSTATKSLLSILLLVVQLSWISPFGVKLYQDVLNALEDSTTLDESIIIWLEFIRFVGYFPGMIGSIIVCLSGLKNSMTAADDKDGWIVYAQYGKRLFAFCIFLFLAGGAQFSLGIYNWSQNSSSLDVWNGPISTVVGGMQWMLAIFGMLRAKKRIQETTLFATLCWIQWLLVLSLVVLGPMGDTSEAYSAPSMACLTFGTNILPALLEFKMQSSIQKESSPYDVEKRQLGGFLAFFGFATLIFPMANTVTNMKSVTDMMLEYDSADDTSDLDLTAFFEFLGGIALLVIGFFAVSTGFCQAMLGSGEKLYTGLLIVLVQLAWIPYVTDLQMLVRMALDASDEDVFIGTSLEDDDGYILTKTDTQFIASMGFLGVLGYGLGMVGSMAFMAFALYAFQSGKPEARPGSYYRGRLVFYCFFLALCGLSQMLLGTYIYTGIDVSPFSMVLLDYPIEISMYSVAYPEIAVYVGCVQIVIALFGMVRARGFIKNNSLFQMACFWNWLVILSLTICTQLYFNQDASIMGTPASRVCLMMGINLFPAYLDYKMRTVSASPVVSSQTESTSVPKKKVAPVKKKSTPGAPPVVVTTSTPKDTQEDFISDNFNDEDMTEEVEEVFIEDDVEMPSSPTPVTTTTSDRPDPISLPTSDLTPSDENEDRKAVSDWRRQRQEHG